jgi:hypothetical protein
VRLRKMQVLRKSLWITLNYNNHMRVIDRTQT